MLSLKFIDQRRSYARYVKFLKVVTLLNMFRFLDMSGPFVRRITNNQKTSICIPCIHSTQVKQYWFKQVGSTVQRLWSRGEEESAGRMQMYRRKDLSWNRRESLLDSSDVSYAVGFAGSGTHKKSKWSQRWQSWRCCDFRYERQGQAGLRILEEQFRQSGLETNCEDLAMCSRGMHILGEEECQSVQVMSVTENASGDGGSAVAVATPNESNRKKKKIEDFAEFRYSCFTDLSVLDNVTGYIGLII